MSKMDKKEKRMICGLWVFIIIFAICLYVIVHKYGDMPTSEVPLWVWWFMG